MSLELHIFGEMLDDEQFKIANLVSSYTKGELGESPQMLPVTPEEIFGKYLGVVATKDGIFAGYVGATKPALHNGLYMPEVGSLWVPKAYRKMGIAQAIVQCISITLDVTGHIPYAFCNPLSSGVFKHANYEEAASDEIPAMAFLACASCPKKPINGCCDTVMKYGGK